MTYRLKKALLSNFRFFLRNQDGYLIGSSNTYDGAESMRQRLLNDTVNGSISIEEVDTETEFLQLIGT